MQEIEANVFSGYECQTKKLKEYGFAKIDGEFVLKHAIADGFEVTIKIQSTGDVDGNIIDIDTGEPFPNFRYQKQTGGFATKLASAYKDLLIDIRDHCFIDRRIPDYWMLPSNPAMYDVEKGFEESNGELEWPAKRKLKVGDVVYIYCAKPVSALKWRCVVTEISDAPRDYYWGKSLYPTVIRLEKTFNGDEFPLNVLLENGLSTVRWLVKMGEQIKAFLIENDPR